MRLVPVNVGGAGAEAAGEKVGQDDKLYFQYEISSFVKEATIKKKKQRHKDFKGAVNR